MISTGLLHDAAEDEQEGQHPERDEPEQHAARRRRPAGFAWPCSQVTTGPATVARIAPTITGSTIVDVRPEQPDEPEENEPDSDEEPREEPRSRSHIGAENTRDSDVASIFTSVSSGTVAASTGSRLP